MGRVNEFVYNSTSTTYQPYVDKLVKETVTEKFDDNGKVIERTTEKVYERVYNNTYPTITF